MKAVKIKNEKLFLVYSKCETMLKAIGMNFIWTGETWSC